MKNIESNQSPATRWELYGKNRHRFHLYFHVIENIKDPLPGRENVRNQGYPQRTQVASADSAQGYPQRTHTAQADSAQGHPKRTEVAQADNAKGHPQRNKTVPDRTPAVSPSSPDKTLLVTASRGGVDKLGGNRPANAGPSFVYPPQWRYGQIPRFPQGKSIIDDYCNLPLRKSNIWIFQEGLTGPLRYLKCCPTLQLHYTVSFCLIDVK